MTTERGNSISLTSMSPLIGDIDTYIDIQINIVLVCRCAFVGVGGTNNNGRKRGDKFEKWW